MSGSVPVSVTTASETITADSAYTYTADSRIVSGGIITYTDANGLNPRSSPAYAGGYTVHTFKTSGWLEVQGGTIPTAQVLVVGSGGKCDRDVANTTYPGGGGGGQVIYNASYGITSSTPAIVGVTTQNSSFNTLVALKGNNGYSPGHGGSSGSGYAGGSYYQYGGGGGGGAGGAGANASGYNTGAAGGAGRLWFLIKLFTIIKFL